MTIFYYLEQYFHILTKSVKSSIVSKRNNEAINRHTHSVYHVVTFLGVVTKLMKDHYHPFLEEKMKLLLEYHCHYALF